MLCWGNTAKATLKELLQLQLQKKRAVAINLIFIMWQLDPQLGDAESGVLGKRTDRIQKEKEKRLFGQLDEQRQGDRVERAGVCTGIESSRIWLEYKGLTRQAW